MLKTTPRSFDEFNAFLKGEEPDEESEMINKEVATLERKGNNCL